jgi:[ribosomal protein S5]-alanine N-acetyltransferase
VTDPILTSERLALAELTPADAPFILELVNEPDFIANIRDAGVRTQADAVRYIEDGPRASYAQHGFGLWRVDERETGQPIGICGLLKRDWLDDPDIGYAILERFRGRGYAVEAARAVLDWARRETGLTRIVAITAPGNAASGAVLKRLGFGFAGPVVPPGADGPSNFYAWEAEAG